MEAYFESVRKEEEDARKYREKMMATVNVDQSSIHQRTVNIFHRSLRHIQLEISCLKEHWPKGSAGREIVKRRAMYLISEMSRDDESETITSESLFAFINLLENHLVKWKYYSNQDALGSYPQIEIYVDPKIKVDPAIALKEVKEMLSHENVPFDEWLIYFKPPSLSEEDFNSSITVRNILN